jgi:hypothetical protein
MENKEGDGIVLPRNIDGEEEADEVGEATRMKCHVDDEKEEHGDSNDSEKVKKAKTTRENYAIPGD